MDSVHKIEMCTISGAQENSKEKMFARGNVEL